MPTKPKRAFELQTGLQPKQMKQMLAHYHQKKETSTKKHTKGSVSIEESYRNTISDTHQPLEEASRFKEEGSRLKDVAIFDYSAGATEQPVEPSAPNKESSVRIMLSLHSTTPSGMLCARLKSIEQADEETVAAKAPAKTPPLVVIRDQTEIRVPWELCNQPEVLVEILDASGKSCTVKTSLADGSHQILTLAEFGNIGLLIQTFC